MILRVGNRFINLAQVTEAFHDPESGEVLVKIAGGPEARIAFHDEEGAELLAMLDAYSALTEGTLVNLLAAQQAKLEAVVARPQPEAGESQRE